MSLADSIIAATALRHRQSISMTEDQFKSHVRQWFTANGFVVTDIPREHGKKTPDFHLSKGGEEYLIELKIKGDDLEELARNSAVLASGQILERSIPLAPRNRLAAIVEDGHRQMLDFDSQLRCFHVLWIHCDGRDTHLLEERFRLTLFGQQRLVSLQREEVIHALYFRNSSFWRFRQGLDGVFLSSCDAQQLAVKLCVNTVSTRGDAFRMSALYDLHRDGLCDPEALERDAGAFIVDGAIDRTDEAAVLAFLRTKYEVEHLQTFDMGAYSVVAPFQSPHE